MPADKKFSSSKTSPIFASSCSYNLTQEHFKVLDAEDGEQALKLIQREKPNLVILDLMLPGLSGMEVCKLLRDAAKPPSCRFSC